MKSIQQPCNLLLQGFVLFAILFASFTLEVDAKATKSVSVELKANWPQTPLPLEIGEFLASEDEELFWKFLDNLGKIRGNTEEEQYTHAFEVATELLSSVQTDLLQYSLAIRYFSPRVQMYRQVYDLQLDELEEATRKQLENQSGAWALFNNQIYSSPSALLEAIRKASSPSAPTIHEFDHVHPSSAPVKTASSIVILYATIGTQPFLDFHSQLTQHFLSQDNTAYVLRHLVPSVGEENAMNLAGYGVELDIKSLEYKAVDDSKVEGGKNEVADITEEDLTEDVQGFVFGKLQQRKPEYSSELAAFKASLLANDVQFEELKQWQLKDIGYQAAQRITAASDPLMLMKEISQNFPTYAVSLSKTKLDPAIKSQIETNRAVEPGRSMVVINGRMVDPQTADPFQLFSILREELNKIDSLQKANVPKDSAFQILSTPSEKSSDVYRIIEDPAPEGESQTSAIVYINDLETDPPYAGWPHSVGEIFRRVWPGSFRFIGKNLFTHVAFIDPSTFEGIYTGFLMEHLMTQQAPIRFALVMVTHGYKESLNPDNFQVNDAVKVVRLFHYINSMYGPREAMAIFKYLRQHSRSSDQIIRNIAQGLVNLRLDMNHIENVVLSNDYQEKYDHFAKRANQFAVEKGIKRTPVQFMNGAMLNPDISIEEMQGTIINSYFFQTHILQQLVRSTEINNDMDIYATLLSRPGTMPRYSDVIVPSQQNPLQYLSLSSESFQAVLNGLEYFPHRYDEVRPISDHVIVDWRSPSGVRLAYYGLKYMMQAPTDTRLSLVFNAPNPQPFDTLLAQSMLAALQSQTSTKSLRFMHNFFEHLHNENEKGQYSDWYYIHGAKTVEFDRETINRIAAESELNMEKFKEAFESLSGGSEVTALLQANKQYVHHMTTALKLPTALQNGLVANGRVVLVQTRRLDEATANPSDNYGSILFAHTDFEFLSNFEFNKRSKKIQETLSQAKFENVEAEAITPAFMSDIIMKATSVIGLDEQHNVEKIIIPSDLWTSFQIRSRNSSENWSNFRIYAIFNPISTAAQRFVPILQSLLDLFDIQLYVILNPSEVGTLPLSHFYTYVLPSKVSFKPDTGAVASPVALLPNLPTSRLLTMKLDTPEAWFVTPTVARYDLDNIKLEDLNANNENVLYAQLELQSIVVEGNCLDVTGVKSVRGGIPPRGLEVVLTDQFAENGDRKPVQTDTIVMSNLGYFQLKSNPGVWKLELRKQTKSSDLYDIIGEMDRKLAHKTIVMSDFNGKFEMLRVRKKAGREGEELLSEENASWNLSGFFGGKKEEETIHVFSVATGHLYERFLKIMMLSVVKQTNSPVKFWLLANYLSPKFKEAIPHMAKQYNFEYELVTYKWPAWLHKQTEKQRIIWGYKILFLDVLFPLNVKKVIYVDADQVVRTDLKELWNMDLEGAPYGYTPFCSDRNEMDGFRFWKQGFWMNHLIGKPYHISALYVVDLVQFRKQGAGDTLRATYAQLAQDPNSLANLDQDLPNYLQHVVKIKSLPQEWLWCETWCSDESKPKAKTIDLCNNPLTKTPKLDNAVRILAEWPDLDNEIKTFEKNWSQQANHPAETNDQHAKHKQVILESTREILL